MPQPKSGIITRSPGEVVRIRRIDSWIFCSAVEVAILPSGVTWSGNFHPVPRYARLGLWLVVAMSAARQRVGDGDDGGRDLDHGVGRGGDCLGVLGRAEGGNDDGIDAGDAEERLG